MVRLEKGGREREFNPKSRIIERADKFGIDSHKKGNKMLCEKHCKLESMLTKKRERVVSFPEFVKPCSHQIKDIFTKCKVY